MIEIQGADQLARLAKQLREAGAKDLQKELGQAINRALRPVKADIRQSAEDHLPKRGGLAADIAASELKTRRRSSQRGAAGVRIIGKNHFSLYHLDQGEIRHKVKGKPPAAWTIQKTRAGWWRQPTEEAAPTVRRELIKAMDTVAKKIDGRRVTL